MKTTRCVRTLPTRPNLAPVANTSLNAEKTVILAFSPLHISLSINESLPTQQIDKLPKHEQRVA